MCVVYCADAIFVNLRVVSALYWKDTTAANGVGYASGVYCKASTTLLVRASVLYCCQSAGVCGVLLASVVARKDTTAANFLAGVSLLNCWRVWCIVWTPLSSI